MRFWLVVLLCLVVLPIQMQLLDWMAIGGIRPDLPATLVYGLGVVTGPWGGGGAGLVVGLLVDRFSGGAIGPHMAAKAMIGFGAGLFSWTLLKSSLLAHASLSFGLFIVQGFWVVLLFRWQSHGAWDELYLTALPEACYTVFTVTIAIWLLRRTGVIRQPEAGTSVYQ